MSTMNEIKQPDNFRVLVGESYCALSKSFHELGCLIPGQTRETAHVFTGLNAANHAIARTVETQKTVRMSMLADYPKFKPLLFEGQMAVERFSPAAPTTAKP